MSARKLAVKENSGRWPLLDRRAAKQGASWKWGLSSCVNVVRILKFANFRKRNNVQRMVRLAVVGPLFDYRFAVRENCWKEFLPRGPVAQLGARFHGMEEVVGSIPTRSTKSIRTCRA